VNGERVTRTSGTWGATFRIHVVGGRESPRSTLPNVQNLRLWLRADLGVTLGGAGVAARADQSGNGNHFTQVTVSGRPTFQPVSLNGKPGLHFDGNDLLRGLGWEVQLIRPEAYTAFFVFSVDTFTIREELLSLAVLALERLQALGVARVHRSELPAPDVERLRADPVLLATSSMGILSGSRRIRTTALR
jgi:hypothetical protein